ncbi:P450-derived glycosyltransferase activator [Nocardiopsis arvandica]|uniref:P450-derived glycosyltransferase activator n=1 Tax=Nocardiopsis sinuspersici TaxID=501010 RepID=A0A7Y9XJL9_9ACTN|nr:P450-derived glycosyltransferase activator [Nocardiopsis sinuspersici]NYH55685.1 P450-derived glycosyltransferase activator [Nocardiopsis sinuspersici]
MSMLDQELGRRLQLAHGLHWLRRRAGDPYAALLCDHPGDTAPVRAAVLARGPLWFSATGVWVTGDHATGAELLAHRSLGAEGVVGASSARERLVRLEGALPAAVVEAEEPPAGTADRSDAAERLCARRLAALPEGFDLSTEVSRPVGVELIAEMLGLGEADLPALASACQGSEAALDSSLSPQTLRVSRRLAGAVDELERLSGRFHERSAHGSLGGTPRETGVLLAVAGLRIAHDLLANSVRALLARSGMWSELAADPGRVALVVRETLRHDPPVRVQVLRAREELTVRGERIPEGGRVAVVIVSANRDPEAFDRPDAFDPDRDEGKGALLPGPPYARVLPFARSLAEGQLRALVKAFPRLAGAGTVANHPRSPLTRRLARLPLHVSCPHAKS